MPHYVINLLGPLEVSCDGLPISFSYDKLRSLLVYLCVERHQPSVRSRLAGMLWPDQPQSGAQDSLRQAISRLRAEMKDRDQQPPLFLVERDSIRLNPKSNLVCDLSQFQEAINQTTTHHHRNLLSCIVCISQYKDAARLIRGDFLEGFYLSGSDLFEDWVSMVRERIRLQEIMVLGNLAQFYNRQGDHRTVLNYSERLIAIDPYNESGYRLIMLSHARSGQRNQAVMVYHKLNQILESDLGILPSTDTQDLFNQIIIEKEPPNPSRLEVYGLPEPLAPLVGREVELAELGIWLSDPDRRLINVIGPGGIGKTRLVNQAIRQVAGMFADGVVYVSLSVPGLSLSLEDAVATTLRLPTKPNASALDGVNTYFDHREILLVMDGFEYFLAEGDRLSKLLETHAGLVVLVTSRERLSLPGEWVFELGGLDVPPPSIDKQLEAYSSVLLFLQAARQVNPSFTLTGSNRMNVCEICRLVGGIPLAIQLAAAWTRSLACQEIALEIQRGLDILSRRPGLISRDSEDSIRAVFEQSWHRLEPADQVIFQRLSVFRLGFDQDAAHHIADATPESLSRLVDHSLLRMSVEDRYDLHDLLIQFGSEKLHQSGEENSVRQRHFRYFFNRAKENDYLLKQEGKLNAFLWLIRESGNLAEALNWSRVNAPESVPEMADWTHFDYHQYGIHLLAQKKQTH